MNSDINTFKKENEMKLKNVLITGLVAFATALAPFAAAVAADVIAPVPFDRPAIVQTVDNFSGPYIGIGGTTILNSNVYTPTISVGIDQRYDAFVFGGEIFGALNVGDQTISTIGFDAKAGFVLTENVAVYAIGGIEVDTASAIGRNAVGVGTDIAITEDVYLTGSYKYVTDLGTFNNPDHRVSIGLKFPF